MLGKTYGVSMLFRNPHWARRSLYQQVPFWYSLRHVWKWCLLERSKISRLRACFNRCLHNTIPESRLIFRHAGAEQTVGEHLFNASWHFQSLGISAESPGHLQNYAYLFLCFSPFVIFCLSAFLLLFCLLLCFLLLVFPRCFSTTQQKQEQQQQQQQQQPLRMIILRRSNTPRLLPKIKEDNSRDAANPIAE